MLIQFLHVTQPHTHTHSYIMKSHWNKWQLASHACDNGCDHEDIPSCVVDATLPIYKNKEC